MSEHVILTNLIKTSENSTEYARKVLPFLTVKYFSEKYEKAVFEAIILHFEKYNILPTRTEVQHYIEQKDSLSDEEYSIAIDYVDSLRQDEVPKFEWLVDTTEAFCQEKSLYNAIMDSISIMDGSDESKTKHAIPEILKNALSISFDTHIGHDYLEDAAERYDFYSLDVERMPFHLDMFNKITNGGVPNKTLNMILATTNAGKTMMMIDFASNYLVQGKNVLYISFEMSEEAIANRIDANVMDIPINDVPSMGKEKFLKQIDHVRQATHGKLIVKEFPTSGASVAHIRNLLQELKLKKNFTPDVIFVDYINIMASSRVKLATTNSYFYIKAIAEELRGLAVEHNLPIWSATQSNRSGHSDTDVDLTNTSESFGLPATVDFMFAIIRTEELDQLEQLLIKQLKSRYGNKNYYEKFVIGVDPERAKLYNLEDDAQNVMQSDGNMGHSHLDKKSTKDLKF